MENEPHEYVVTKMRAYPDENVRPLNVRIECATDRGGIILRVKSVIVQQLLGPLTAKRIVQFPLGQSGAIAGCHGACCDQAKNESIQDSLHDWLPHMG